MDAIPEILIWVLLLSFFWEFIDASAGMGFGTAMCPILLLMDFAASEIVPALLISNVGVGLVAWLAHHKFKNIDFQTSPDRKLIWQISLSGLVAVLIAVWVAISLPERIIVGYIAVLIIGIGIYILTRKDWTGGYSKWRIIGTSFFAAFNKVLTGGGFGPIVVGGQVTSGITSRKAVGIATLAEGFTSLMGALAFYMIEPQRLNWSLTFSILIGSMLAVPLAAFVISRLPEQKHRSFIGTTCIVVGLLALYKYIIN